MLIEHTHIVSTPLSETWPSWMMLLLLLVMAAAISHQPGMLQTAFRGLITRMERTYSDASADLMSQMLTATYRIGILAMTLYVLFFGTGHFSVLIYLMVIGCIVVYELLRSTMTWLVGYTFFSLRGLEEPRTFYRNLCLITSVVLFPVTLVMMNIGTGLWAYILLAVIGITFIVLLTIRLFRVFMSTPISIIYILLYVVTVEFLPLAALCSGVGLLVTQ